MWEISVEIDAPTSSVQLDYSASVRAFLFMYVHEQLIIAQEQGS